MSTKSLLVDLNEKDLINLITALLISSSSLQGGSDEENTTTIKQIAEMSDLCSRLTFFLEKIKN